MQDHAFRVAELSLQGFTCSHILLQLGLDALGRENPDLMRAMSGLALGMGNGLDCGVLTVGCCLLGLYAGKSGRDDDADARLPLLLEEFTEWFRDEAGARFGGIRCADIMGNDPQRKVERCPALTLAAAGKVFEILEANGFGSEGDGDASRY
ncbi:DVU_1555 family C-GCAxxG-C-C protein [Paludibacterium yongneupense]|uniref:DVU_1555 family C-GCAxxG-C-C protein n=1 Tax=Paludibacterium yongneupense TaxID=400061 RepID=UPI000414E9E9|nr:DV_1555 family C-GCAxxG-C-C protein [Paludibacterium yongneupense]